MKNITEIDVMKIIDDHFSKIQDREAKNRILRWAWEKFSTQELPLESEEKTKQKDSKKKKAPKKNNKQKKKVKSGPCLVKDLNLRPSGETTFKQFVQDKNPSSNQEKCLVAAYYLKQKLKKKTDVDSIYTCFKDAKWRVPSNLENTLCVVAVQKGWLDTTDSNAITIPTLGENYIEHDLPRKVKGKNNHG